MVETLYFFLPVFDDWVEGAGKIQVFQISPTTAREYGVPKTAPLMGRFGEDLPTVVDMIKEKFPDVWAKILGYMSIILSRLESIDVDYTTNRMLSLFFQEEGIGRPWGVHEVSDGTIHSLAALTALFDPRSSFLVLEEPENSVHTWILRSLMEATVDASSDRQIVLTTHSKFVVDAVSPEDVWVMWRDEVGSHLKKAEEFDADMASLVVEGEMTMFEALDAGVVPEAIPAQRKPEAGN